MGGFLPWSDRSFFMMDLVSLAMFLILPILGFSIYQIKVKKNYVLHKKFQMALGFILLTAVLLFEIQVRIVDWKSSAMLSPYYDTYLYPLLYVHLVFALSTFLLLVGTYYNDYKTFKNKTLGAGLNSSAHKKLGPLSSIGLVATSLTGWAFYYMAFIA